MQTSGSCPQFSDGARKTITTKAPGKAPAVRRTTRAIDMAPSAPSLGTHERRTKAAPAHRAGGYAKHARRAK